MEISARTKKICERLSIEPEDIVYCDLMRAGWLKYEAIFFSYKLAYLDKNRCFSWMIEHQRSRPGIETLLKEFQEEDKKNEEKLKAATARQKNEEKRAMEEEMKAKAITEESLRTKAGMLEYLIKLASTSGLDLKTKADIAKQITDLQQYKKEEIAVEDNRIHFFLPLTCCKCELYKSHMNKENEPEALETANTGE